MKIKLITEKTIWENFFDKNCCHSFLHSWEWGEFQRSLGYPIIRLGLYNKDNQLEVICLVVKIKSKRGSFLFVPHGPVINQKSKVKSQKLILKLIKNYLLYIAKKENYSFIRIAPILEDKKEYQKIFADLGFKTAPIYMHAETMWELPLINKTNEDLLYQMRKTTRYLIKKAIRDGVIIEKTTNPKALKIFYHLYLETVKREKFNPFSFDFIKKEFEAFAKSKNVMIFLAKMSKEITGGEVEGIPPTHSTSKIDEPIKKMPPNYVLSNNQDYSKNTQMRIGGRETETGPVIASSIIFFTKAAAFYHQGASLHTKIPAAYLLQWEVIKEAKNRGCQLYNFWGIYDEKRPQRTPKSWQGLTLFKTGFGGQIHRFLPTQDYIISNKYYFTYLWEKFLMWMRLK